MLSTFSALFNTRRPSIAANTPTRVDDKVKTAINTAVVTAVAGVAISLFSSFTRSMWTTAFRITGQANNQDRDNPTNNENSGNSEGSEELDRDRPDLSNRLPKDPDQVRVDNPERADGDHTMSHNHSNESVDESPAQPGKGTFISSPPRTRRSKKTTNK